MPNAILGVDSKYGVFHPWAKTKNVMSIGIPFEQSGKMRVGVLFHWLGGRWPSSVGPLISFGHFEVLRLASRNSNDEKQK